MTATAQMNPLRPQRQLNQLRSGAPAASAGQASQQKKLRQACRMFEAQFLKMMLGEMRKTVDKSASLISGGMGEDIFQDMMDQAITDSATKNGSMGLADLMERQLSQASGVRPSGALAAYQRQLKAAGQLRMPVQGTLTSPFGPRISPISGREETHEGMDLAAPEGSPVAAAKSGVVAFAGERGGYGNLVVLEHGDGTSTWYGHLSEIEVTEGQRVDAGQTLALVGSTGDSTGPHLHFELRDASGRPVDPAMRLAGEPARVS